MSGPRSPADTLLDTATTLFGQPESRYVNVPALIGTGRLCDRLKKKLPSANPLVFLTGVWDESLLDIREDEVGEVEPAAARSVSLVVAEFGTGKSELLRRLCWYLQTAQVGGPPLPVPLPVDLAWCRERKALLDAPLTANGFWDLVFGGLCKKAIVDSALCRDEVRDRVRRGEVMLVLDGLDELNLGPDTVAQQHKHFFAGLTAYAGGVPGPLRVVVSMRLEYLLEVTPTDASVFATGLGGGLGEAAVDFVELGYFSDPVIGAYFEQREWHGLLAELQANKSLLDILSRPLYLRLFSDLYKPADAATKTNLLRINHVGELFEEFVDLAADAGAMIESGAPAELPRGKWDTTKLAVECLRYYEEGKDRLPLSALSAYIDFDDGVNVPADVVAEARWHYVHKCPFLQRAPQSEMRFAHRAFLEFFTAKGIAYELVYEGKPAPFDELVASVDMRKILAYFVEEYRWKKDQREKNDPDQCYVEETRRGNAMTGPWLGEGWDPPLVEKSERWWVLENHRAVLLKSMIRPETFPPVSNSVEWFLENESDGLHTRYVMYNYEAVAVNIRYRWAVSHYREISARFSDILRRRLDKLISDPKDDADLLLIHRIIDIARRLCYDWIVEKVGDIRKAVGPSADTNIGRRIDVALRLLSPERH